MDRLVQSTEQQRRRVDGFRARHQAGILILPFTDIVPAIPVGAESQAGRLFNPTCFNFPDHFRALKPEP